MNFNHKPDPKVNVGFCPHRSLKQESNPKVHITFCLPKCWNQKNPKQRRCSVRPQASTQKPEPKENAKFCVYKSLNQKAKPTASCTFCLRKPPGHQANTRSGSSTYTSACLQACAIGVDPGLEDEALQNRHLSPFDIKLHGVDNSVLFQYGLD